MEASRINKRAACFHAALRVTLEIIGYPAVSANYTRLHSRQEHLLNPPAIGQYNVSYG